MKLTRLLGFIPSNIVYCLISFLTYIREYVVIFVVYPATPKYVHSLSKFWPLVTKLETTNDIRIVSFIYDKNKIIGIVVGINYNIAQLFRNADTIYRRLLSIINRRGSNNRIWIALAGQIPSILHRKRFLLPKQICDGRIGSSYIVEQAVEMLIVERDLCRSALRILIFGRGYLGEYTQRRLRERGLFAISYDISMARGEVEKSAFIVELGRVDVVILMSSRGNDFKKYLGHLRRGAVIIDDTYPALRHGLPDVEVYQAVGKLRDVRIDPPLPEYSGFDLPGCLVEALIRARNRYSDANGWDVLGEDAQSLGVEVHLVKSVGQTDAGY